MAGSERPTSFQSAALLHVTVGSVVSLGGGERPSRRLVFSDLGRVFAGYVRTCELTLESLYESTFILTYKSFVSFRTQLIAARALAGMGGGGLAVVNSVIVSDLVSLKERGLYQGLTNLLFGLGSDLIDRSTSTQTS